MNLAVYAQGLLVPRWDDRQQNPATIPTHLYVIQACKLAWGAILRMLMRKQAHTLRVVTRDLQHERFSGFQHRVRRPHFYVNWILIILYHRQHISTGVAAIWQVRAVQRMCLVHLAVRNTQPPLDNGSRIADAARVEYFISLLVQLAQGGEDIYIRRGCIVRVELTGGNGQVYDDMPRNLNGRAGRIMELDRVPVQIRTQM